MAEQTPSPPPLRRRRPRPRRGTGTRPARKASRSLLLRWAPIAIAAAYFAVMMPIGAHMILHYPDERHYAYGGARMVETGDWLIPRTPEGEVRLKKPIIPYWFSAAGFEVLGIGVPGFRLFWVIAASGILLLTYALAREPRRKPAGGDSRGTDACGQPGVHARRDQFDSRHPAHPVRHRRRRLASSGSLRRGTSRPARAGPGSAGSGWRSPC